MKKLLEIVNQPQLKQKQMLENQEFRKFVDQVLIGIIYGQHYLKQKNYQVDHKNTFKLQEFPADKKGTLALDLDETLITTQIADVKAEHTIFVEGLTINFSIRPFAKEMISILSQYYEIVIFTASKFEYAVQVVKYLDPQHQFISALIDRNFCYQTENGVQIKDLRTLGNRSLDKILIVDNLSLSFCFQPQNGIPVTSWMGDAQDRELQTLTIYLSQLSQSNNLRQANYENFKFSSLLEMYTKLNA